MNNQAAITLLKGLEQSLDDYCELNDEGKTAFRMAIMALEQSERKKGKWINNSPVTMKCDQCGYVIRDWKWNELNFCANCGADMRGEQGE